MTKPFPHSAFKAWSKEYDIASNTAIDWLTKSWKLEDEDKQIAELYYKKACKERVRVVKRLEGIWQK